MRLTSLSFTRHCLMWHRGKYRKQPKIKFEDLMKLRKDLQREEENMLILRHPYLTVEQSHGHMAGKKDVAKIIEGFNQRREIKFAKYVTIEDRLNHLKVKEVWD